MTPSAKKAKHDPDVMRQAVEAVKSKRMSLRKAAQHFGIASSTISDKVTGKTPLIYVPHSLLTAIEEERLFTWLVKMSELGFGQTTDDIRAKVKKIIDLRGPPISNFKPKEGEESNMPSSAWVYRFFQRHPEITLRTPMSLVKERALVTPFNIHRWFLGLETHCTTRDPTLLSDPSRIFNADESGFSFNPKQRKVVAWKGAKTVYTVTSNTKKQVTVLAAMSAAGLYLPPLLIYPYRRCPGKELLKGFPSAKLQVSDNGWITAAIFYAWLRDSFVPATAHIKKPLLLLVDGHGSHTSLIETSKLCEDNGIILYCLLSHSSHLIQPLDQAFFASIKSAWSTASRQQMAETGDAVGLDTFAKVFRPVWESCSTITNAQSSFRAAGIVPFSPERVLGTTKMIPCQAFRPTATTDTAAQTQTLIDDDEPMPPAPLSDSNEECPAALPPLETIIATPSSVPTLALASTPGPVPTSASSPSPVLSPLSTPIPVPTSAPTPTLVPTPIPVPAPASSPSPVPTPVPTPIPVPAPASFSSPVPTPVPTPIPVPTSAPTPIPVPAPASSPSPVLTPSTETSSSEDCTFSAKQLEAMKDFALFVFDDLGRNAFLSCFRALSRDGAESHEATKFAKFQSLANNLRSSFQRETVAPQSRAPLTLDNILRVPSFSDKKKVKKNPKMTLQFVLSGEEHREAITLKKKKKEKEDKEKLVRKTAREEKTRQKKENEETRARVARQTKSTELQRKCQEKKDQALFRKMAREANKKTSRDSCSCSDEDERIVEREMEQTMREADEDVEDVHGDDCTCRGCGEKGGEVEL